MSENADRETIVRQIGDFVGVTALNRIRHLFRERFGREPGSLRDLRRDLKGWLCTELNYEASEVDALSLNELAKLLAADHSKLSLTDRQILEALPPGQVMTHDEIADGAGYKPKSVRTRLQPGMPLRRLGFIRRLDGSPGYERGPNFWSRDSRGTSQGQQS